MQNTKWIAGNVIRYPLGPTSNIVKAIQKCQNTNKTGRLYLTDGSMMDYEATEYPRNAPGVPCKVDEAVNSMMPHAVASTRSTNLFHAVKVLKKNAAGLVLRNKNNSNPVEYIDFVCFLKVY